jgi:hypothetical protein
VTGLELRKMGWIHMLRDQAKDLRAKLGLAPIALSCEGDLIHRTVSKSDQFDV